MSYKKKIVLKRNWCFMKRSMSAKGVSKLLSMTPKTDGVKRNSIVNKRISEGEKKAKPSKLLKTRWIDNNNGRIFYANEDGNTNNIIIYIPGGAFCNEMTTFHWLFLKKIIKNTNAKVIIPTYRLIPFGTYQDAFDLIIPIYQESLKENKRIIIMGDSAGGGLAISLNMFFKKNNIKLPDKLILLSPWLDISMKNKKIDDYKSLDPLLDKEGLIVAGRLWKDELDDCDWRVSPIYGDVKSINNLTTFVGTSELFYPDIIELYKKLDKSNNKLIVGKDMNHAYPLMPIPEAKEALKIIVDTIIQ